MRTARSAAKIHEVKKQLACLACTEWERDGNWEAVFCPNRCSHTSESPPHGRRGLFHEKQRVQVYILPQSVGA